MKSFLVDAPFNRKGWLFEIKWDGFRAIAHLDKSKILLYSINFQSFNERFPTIVQALKKLGVRAVLDGEIVALDAKGKSHFELLQNYQRKPCKIAYYVFDILSFQDEDLTHLPLIDRKKILKALLPKKNPLIRVTEYCEEKGISFFKKVRAKGFEGIMAKNAQSPYTFHRSPNWLKIKAKLGQEVVIGGFTAPRGSRKRMGSLLVGTYEKDKFIYAGHVGGGFSDEALEALYAELKPLIQKSPSFSKFPKSRMPVTWVKPKLVCEVEFMNWTKEGVMRQPIFKGLREDKRAKEVHREQQKNKKLLYSN